jgi:response regulator RpfG family c-di-GMP phosphodiesterase
VLISDYSMPDMNGAELLRGASLRWPDITRVLLTGNADMPAAVLAVNDGRLSRLYTKPWQPDDFRRAVAEALEQHRTLVENQRLQAEAVEQSARLAQWNEQLEGIVVDRTTELQQANETLGHGLLEMFRLLQTFLGWRLPELDVDRHIQRQIAIQPRRRPIRDNRRQFAETECAHMLDVGKQRA